MTKKRSSEILAVKMEIFSEKKRHSEILVCEKISVPQTRRQVSATDTRYLQDMWKCDDYLGYYCTLFRCY